VRQAHAHIETAIPALEQLALKARSQGVRGQLEALRMEREILSARMSAAECSLQERLSLLNLARRAGVAPVLSLR
jgi:hypothetical protein